MKDEAGRSRRDFFNTCVAGAVALGAGEMAIAKTPFGSAGESKSKAVITRDEAFDGASSTPDSVRVEKLLDKAMQSFFGASDPVTPGKKIVRPGEVVGLKVNTIAGQDLSTNRALVEAISERWKQAGVKPGTIVGGDRWSWELERVGYHITTDVNRERVDGTDAAEIGREAESLSFGKVSRQFSKLLTRTCECTINLPLLKDHELGGVTCALKNMYGAINKPNKLHDDNCSPYVADLYMIPPIKEKFRFAICDAMTGISEGGPMYKPEYTWKYNGLIAASDPVDLDYTRWQIIERKRAEKGLKSQTDAGRPPKYFAVAADAQHRLGTDEPTRIALTEV